MGVGVNGKCTSYFERPVGMRDLRLKIKFYIILRTGVEVKLCSRQRNQSVTYGGP